MNRILVVAVHPDDETIGCGGTLLKHKKNGDEIYWCIVTSMYEENGFTAETVQRRDKEIETVARSYGFDGIECLGFATKALDVVPIRDLVEKFSKVIQEVKPHTVYLPFKNDVHSDHRVAFQAAYSCTKAFRSPFLKRILMMEVLSETEFVPAAKEDFFVPNVYVDMSDFMEKKLEIIECYKDELESHPFPRSARNIRALATLRGATAGVEYAESFMLLKEIT